jgi:hypothetical protein
MAGLLGVAVVIALALVVAIGFSSNQVSPGVADALPGPRAQTADQPARSPSAEPLATSRPTTEMPATQVAAEGVVEPATAPPAAIIAPRAERTPARPARSRATAASLSKSSRAPHKQTPSAEPPTRPRRPLSFDPDALFLDKH